MILHEIFRLVSRFPRYISLYIAESRLPLGQCIQGAIKNYPDNMDISSTHIGRGLMTEKELKSSTF